MNKRIWVVSELYYPEERATGYYLTNIAEALAQYYPVMVICRHPGYSRSGTKALSIEYRQAVLIHRVRSTRFDKDKLLFRTVNLITFSVSVFVKALWKFRRGDDVLVVTNPPSVPFLVAIACKIRGAKCYLLIHDVYPEVLVVAKVLRGRSRLTSILLALNTWLYRNAHQIIVLGRDMEKAVAAKIPHETSKISVIPNWADLNRVVPLERSENELLHELGLQEKFVIQYSGNMGRTHGLECILNAAQRVQDDPKLHFLLMGSGAKRDWVEHAIKANGIRNISMLPSQPWDALSVSLNACDIALISLVTGMAGISVPSRIYNILAAGKPLIAVCDEESELALVVHEENIGWVVPPDRPEELAQILREARSQPYLLEEMGQRARRAAEKKYSYPQAMETYVRIFSDDGRASINGKSSANP